jgi:hypothetical protein
MSPGLSSQMSRRSNSFGCGAPHVCSMRRGLPCRRAPSMPVRTAAVCFPARCAEMHGGCTGCSWIKFGRFGAHRAAAGTGRPVVGGGHGARSAGQHHQPGPMGRRRVDAARGTGIRQGDQGPALSITPPPATTTRQRIRRPSSARSSPITPVRWAGATSPTTRWLTNSGGSSRADSAASPNPSRAHTPADSTQTPGRCA